MRISVPTRVNIVFASLVMATCVTWWLGSGHALVGQMLAASLALTVAIAFTKIYFIGQDFMELRGGPRPLRVVFAAWVGVFGTAAAVLSMI